jgi:hypothetical protein
MFSSRKVNEDRQADQPEEKWLMQPYQFVSLHFILSGMQAVLPSLTQANLFVFAEVLRLRQTSSPLLS